MRSPDGRQRIDAVQHRPDADDQQQYHIGQRRHDQRKQRSEQECCSDFREHGGGICDGQRFPEEHAAVAAIIVEGTQQVEEHDEEQDHAEQGDEGNVGEVKAQARIDEIPALRRSEISSQGMPPLTWMLAREVNTSAAMMPRTVNSNMIPLTHTGVQ